jgi:replicative DNA helicase
MAIENKQRKLPFSLEAEQSVLGSILVDPQKISEIASLISVEDFYLEEHREIFSSMQKLFLQSKEIDIVLLMDALVQEGVYDLEQSKSYIRTIAEIVPSSENVKDYATIVRDKALLRKLIEVCGDITEDAYGEQDTASNIINSAESKVFAIAQTKEQKDFAHIRDVLIETYRQIQEIAENKGDVGGVPTGFSGIDQVLVGLGKSDLVLVGARPGMGKTSFCLNVASNIARSTKKAVAIFSLEMSASQLVSRMLSSEAMVDSTSLRSGRLSNDDWRKLAQASSFLSECDILIDDTTGITVTGMKAKLRRVKNLGLVVIDYLGLMQSDRRIENRVNEVAEISRNLKVLAKELNVPVICCAQLSRGPESRTDKRPMLSDLRDSGAIEQDADIVLFLYREEYYKSDPEKQNTAEVIIAKNRHGSTGNVPIGWQGQYTKFTSIDATRIDENTSAKESGGKK